MSHIVLSTEILDANKSKFAGWKVLFVRNKRNIRRFIYTFVCMSKERQKKHFVLTRKEKKNEVCEALAGKNLPFESIHVSREMSSIRGIFKKNNNKAR